jgi:hypothetical protein
MDRIAGKIRRVVTRLFLIGLFIGVASSASAGWVQDGIDWKAWPKSSSVGDCFGNCGAACSDRVNPCGGPRQYWDLVLTGGPVKTQTGWEATSCEAGEYYVRPYTEYHAMGRWTYHGWVKPFCIAHDATCNQLIVGCLWAAPCGIGHTKTWSYQEWMRGYTLGRWEYGGPC